MKELEESLYYFDEVIDYEKLLKDAIEHFRDKEVNYMSVGHWLTDIGLGKYLTMGINEKIIFKLRQDLWNKQKTKPRTE